MDLPPERRRVGLVHQEGALFPHLSVRDNVAFGARDPARVDELLRRLRIAPLAAERPGRISGGERQRTALARALARDPGVLALDEPLSALDASTRTAVRAELQDVLAELRLPALLVTHDFADAAVLADRIGVMAAGRLRQVGTPRELVERPADAFVAQLTGANVLWGEADGAVVALDGGGSLAIPAPARGRVALAIAPWHVRLREDGLPDGHAVPVRVAAVTPEHGRMRVRTDRLVAEVPEAGALARGSVAWAVVRPEHVRVLD